MKTKHAVEIHLGQHIHTGEQCIMVLFSNGVFYHFPISWYSNFKNEKYKMETFTAASQYKVIYQISHRGML